MSNPTDPGTPHPANPDTGSMTEAQRQEAERKRQEEEARKSGTPSSPPSSGSNP